MCCAVPCALHSTHMLQPRVPLTCHSLPRALADGNPAEDIVCTAVPPGAPHRAARGAPELTRRRVRRVHRVLHDLHPPAARRHRHQGLGGRRPHRWRARGHDDGRAARRASWPWRSRGRGRGPLAAGPREVAAAGRRAAGRCVSAARRRHGQGPTAGGMDMR